MISVCAYYAWMTPILLSLIRPIDPDIDHDQPVPAAGDGGVLDRGDLLALLNLCTLVRTGGAL
ncbi:hypothetical protein [Agrobacterium vitis]|uniref:hypothetical protein n=1 Tax=Agrobacterium vitis TaxID=373 RepID=UPI001571C28A|nr:hypothetical protein [Agrobacterium vitis]NSZ17163.1 hypothetical protein [Agrobacterium vitis]QZO02892.1 hypothetical protein K4831_10480 [Agrobacterium vitis]QZO04423.1 hypothetical protein K4831_02315 [Agrobacterium vitis]UJL86565.1 hypothetical protein AVF2S5_00650 [Agrobacterium vitis]UJL88017.1 hypothetical protein AVF2S5_08820 [Agrobacterium vitis]